MKNRLIAKVVSVHAGAEEALDKPACDSIEVELDGVVGDRHRSFERSAWAGDDKQPEGTRRRNERQWSAVSVEELEAISQAMQLEATLDPADVGANLCIDGLPVSGLPKGSLLEFPSGAVLVVEEYNPPCRDMGESLAGKYAMSSGERPAFSAFSKAARLSRGVVGVVDVPGVIRSGDEVTVTIYEHPPWLKNLKD